MRIVLLGATGFLGHHLLPELAAAGHDCIALSRYKPGCRELALVPGAQIRQVDIHDAGALKSQLEGADAAINMVGILNESGRSGRGFAKAHIEVVEKLIGACQERGVRRLLQVSALNAGQGRSHYLRSKGRAEELIREASDIDATIFQPSVIFGEGDSFFNRFAGLLKWAPVMPLACPNAKMQPVWAGDVVAAMAASLDDPDTFGRTFVLVGPDVYTLRELVEWTAKTIGKRRLVVGLPDPLSRLQGFLMDFVPGKPFSSDNYLSLQIDNTSVENALWSFGIRPRSLKAVVPAYLLGSRHQERLDRCREQIGH